MKELFEELGVLVPWVVLLSVRVGVAFASMPAPLGSQAPAQVRAALGVMVAFVLALPFRDSITQVPLDAAALGFAAIGELILGLGIGMVARTAIVSAEAAGELIAGSMGLGFAQSMDPHSGEHTGYPAQVLGAVAIVLFFVLDGHHTLLAALGASVRVAPPGLALTRSLPVESMATIGANVIADGLRIASPIVASMLIVQFAVGFVSRAAPRVQIFTLSFATASTVGLFALGVAAPSMLEAIAQILGEVPGRIDSALAGIGRG
jgi:flagellar biosynthesis protein FliR